MSSPELSELVPTLLKNKKLAMYKCTSDTSLDIYSAATSGVQIAKEDCVRFQITDHSENVPKAPSEKVLPESNTDHPPRAIEALSESEDLGSIGRIVESFNMEDFWHALFLGKYLFLTKTKITQMRLTNCDTWGKIVMCFSIKKSNF